MAQNQWDKILQSGRLTTPDYDYCNKHCGNNQLFACEQPCIEYEVYHRLKTVEDILFN